MVHNMPTLPHQFDQETILAEWGRHSLLVKEQQISLLQYVLQIL